MLSLTARARWGGIGLLETVDHETRDASRRRIIVSISGRNGCSAGEPGIRDGDKRAAHGLDICVQRSVRVKVQGGNRSTAPGHDRYSLQRRPQGSFVRISDTLNSSHERPFPGKKRHASASQSGLRNTNRKNSQGI